MAGKNLTIMFKYIELDHANKAINVFSKNLIVHSIILMMIEDKISTLRKILNFFNISTKTMNQLKLHKMKMKYLNNLIIKIFKTIDKTYKSLLGFLTVLLWKTNFNYREWFHNLEMYIICIKLYSKIYKKVNSFIKMF